ncbi:hypothetical protein WN944_005648 [Citrus x changshan-huyou]|uniref:Uncharacterized protein n=1 Tax=Citrus x changshan-huyou TaxID=2935761 RepID=A0AAP0MHN1_9ROSI
MQNAATNEAASHSAHDTSTVVPPVVHDVSNTNAETSEALNEVITTEATHVISSDPPAVADVPPPSTVTLPSVVRASPERMFTDLVPVVDEMDSGFGTPIVTAAGSMATTFTPVDALGLLSSYVDPYTRMIGGGVSSRDAPYDDVPLYTLNTQCTDLLEGGHGFRLHCRFGFGFGFGLRCGFGLGFGEVAGHGFRVGYSGNSLTVVDQGFTELFLAVMASTTVGGGQQLPPAAHSTAGELPTTGRQPNPPNQVQ